MGYDEKAVRFDVYVEDADNSVYDLEMQTTTNKNLPKRSRYYQGMMDLEQLGEGQDYRSLRRNYVIFICLEDPFPPYGRALYRFQQMCVDDPDIVMQDETEKIFLNASGSDKDSGQDLKQFLKYLLTEKPASSFTEDLDAAVQDARWNEEWRLSYMTLQMKIQDERAEAKEEGRQEGLVEGMEKGRLSSLTEMLKNGFTDDQIRKIYSESEIKKVRELLQNSR